MKIDIYLVLSITETYRTKLIPLNGHWQNKTLHQAALQSSVLWYAGGTETSLSCVARGAQWINQSSGAKHSCYYSVFAGMYYMYLLLVVMLYVVMLWSTAVQSQSRWRVIADEAPRDPQLTPGGPRRHARDVPRCGVSFSSRCQPADIFMFVDIFPCIE